MAHFRRSCSLFFVIFLSFFLFSQTAYSLPPDLGLEHEAKAAPDECFCGIGDSNNGPPGDCTGVTPDMTDPTPPQDPADCTCANFVCGPNPSCDLLACRLKVNES